jgi:hypothetical protein
MRSFCSGHLWRISGSTLRHGAFVAGLVSRDGEIVRFAPLLRALCNEVRVGGSIVAALEEFYSRGFIVEDLGGTGGESSEFIPRRPKE